MLAARFDLRRLLRTIRSRSKEFSVRARTRDWLAIDIEPPTFSFTFDDAPSSAYALGASILEELGCRGTFFLCGKFVETATDGFINAPQAQDLCKRGHTVGVHTYDHVGAQQITASAYRRDVARGMEVVSRLIDPRSAQVFSYPYGQVTSSAKAAISDLVAVARTTFPGVNRRTVDRLLVRGNRLYSSSLSPRHLSQLMESGLTPHTWTVFYTHDVSPDPSRYGVTPEHLRATIEQCLQMGGKIVPFAEPLAAPARQPVSSVPLAVND